MRGARVHVRSGGVPTVTIHWIKQGLGGHPMKIVTHCGIEAWDTGVSNEYDTAACSRIEADPTLKTVNCKRCLASENRIATTRRRDRSRVGR